MPFKKAKSEQGFVKMAIYGPPGRGKTFTSLLWAEGLAKVTGKRIAFVDTEHGSDFYAMKVKERAIHPEAFDFDVLHTQSMKETAEAVYSLDPEKHGILIIDSISHLWDACINAVPEEDLTKIGSIPMHLWGSIKKPYKALVKYEMELPMHVFILGRQKNIFEDDADGQMKKIGVGMRAEGETEYEPALSIRMEARRGTDPTQKTTILAIIEKDRTGILAGRTLANPKFSDIEPLLQILNGKTQAKSHSLEEIAEKDSDLLNGDAEKDAASSKKFDEFEKLITEAKDLRDLNALGTKIKKSRTLVELDKDTLRKHYQRQFKKFTGKEVAA